MTRVSEAVDEARIHLGVGGEPRVRLSADITDTDTTIGLASVDQIVKHSVLDLGPESMFVLDVDDTNAQVEVERGYDGDPQSFSANHIVLIDPLITRTHLARAVRREVTRMEGDGIFSMKAVQRTYDKGLGGIDISDLRDVISFYSLEFDDGSEKVEVKKFYSDTSVLRPHWSLPGGKTLKLNYRARIQAPRGWESEMTGRNGLPESALDIPPLGAAAQSVQMLMARRVSLDAQPQPRRAEEVAPENLMQVGQFLRSRRDDRVRQEVMNLRKRWPIGWH